MIVVDDLFDTTGGVPVTGYWPYKQSCHLMSTLVGPEGIAELHTFAQQKLGLKRAWAQQLDRCPHYDLTASKRAAAIRAGATPLNRHDMVEQAFRPWGEYCRAHQWPAPPERPIFGVTPPPPEQRGCLDGGGRRVR